MGIWMYIAIGILVILGIIGILKRKGLWRELRLWGGNLKCQVRLWSAREFVVLIASLFLLILGRIQGLDFMTIILAFLVFVERMDKKKVKKLDFTTVKDMTWNELFREIHLRWMSIEFGCFFSAFIALLIGRLDVGFYMLTVGGFLGMTGISKVRQQVEEKKKEYENKD